MEQRGETLFWLNPEETLSVHHCCFPIIQKLYHHVNSGWVLSWAPCHCLRSATSRAELDHIQRASVHEEGCTTSLPATTVHLYRWRDLNNCSHGICFVCNNIFEPQVSSTQLTSDLSLMMYTQRIAVMVPCVGKTTSGVKASDVYTGQRGDFLFSWCNKER